MLPLLGDEVEAKSKMVDVDVDKDDHEVVDQLLRKLPGTTSLPVLPPAGEVFDTSDNVIDADDVVVESELVLAAMLESTVPLEVIHSEAVTETPVIPPPPPEPPPSSLNTSDKHHHHQVLRESRHIRKLTAVINFHIRLGHAPIRAMEAYLASCINDLGITQADCDLLPDCHICLAQ